MKGLRKLRYLFLTVVIAVLVSFSSIVKAADGYYYQLKIYHFKTQTQEDLADKYLQNAYLPALHRLGVKSVGVFKPVEGDTLGKRIYVFIPFKTWDQFKKADQQLTADQQYQTDGKDFIDASYKDAPYTRIETILLSAFPKMLFAAVPELTAKKTDRIYELRSYESATEKYNVNKVKMFNDGDEVALFKRLGFNAVFYSEVIAGAHMPNLMYMVTFNSMADHDKLWKAFGEDPYWKTLSAKAEYQNNVSHVDAIFLHPAAYSDF
ncbi:NIPSNAP family protein [Mucilaginibacter sp. BJC16-A38]|uniref:NIPSNAP family protein n=1 Tax=Mucilaginibacter phenanthrenivorans TaxID=1234842 RepID=UPI0021587856|nr:NIPSNAP family protein [Mucilaginibacter phenanthrenivorans]MCR8559961.1 NIPSNAP family protein [Mucilaginibacter phenanthrenivorans]